MSSRYVRTTVRNWLNQGNVPYYDTVNQEQDPTDDIWSTVDWGMQTRAMETYCRETVEDGAFTVIFFGRPGIGDDALLQASEAEMDLLMLRVDTSGRLVLLDRGVPIDFRQEDHFCVEYLIGYEYRE
jgi:hypothetical protein